MNSWFVTFGLNIYERVLKGPGEKLNYETTVINFENIPQAKSENLGKMLYNLTAKKKIDLTVIVIFFGITDPKNKDGTMTMTSLRSKSVSLLNHV